MGSEVSRTQSIPLVSLPAPLAHSCEGNNEPRETTLAYRLRHAERNMWVTGNEVITDVKGSNFIQAIGTMIGHAVQQLATCGGTTFAREEIFMRAYHAMLPVIDKNAAPALIAAQVAVSAANIGSNFYREARLQSPYSEEAVRGHFGLQKRVWDDLPVADQAKLQARHKKASKTITHTQAVAEAIFLVISAVNLRYGDGALAAQVLSAQIRSITYAALRETAQASVSLVTSKKGEPTAGVNPQNMKVNATFYTVTTLAMSCLQDVLIRQALPIGQTVAGPALSNNGKPLTGDELNHAINLIASIRGLTNTCVEFVDAFLVQYFDLKQVGDTGAIQTNLKKIFPLNDYERLLDHSFVRVSWNNISAAVPLAMSYLIRGKVNADAQQLIINSSTAAIFGLTYLNTNRIYQAHAKTRASRAAAKIGKPQSARAQAEINIASDPPMQSFIGTGAAETTSLMQDLSVCLDIRSPVAQFSRGSSTQLTADGPTSPERPLEDVISTALGAQREISTESNGMLQRADTQLRADFPLGRSASARSAPTAKIEAAVLPRRAISLGSAEHTARSNFDNPEKTNKNLSRRFEITVNQAGAKASSDLQDTRRFLFSIGSEPRKS